MKTIKKRKEERNLLLQYNNREDFQEKINGFVEVMFNKNNEHDESCNLSLKDSYIPNKAIIRNLKGTLNVLQETFTDRENQERNLLEKLVNVPEDFYDNMSNIREQLREKNQLEQNTTIKRSNQTIIDLLYEIDTEIKSKDNDDLSTSNETIRDMTYFQSQTNLFDYINQASQNCLLSRETDCFLEKDAEERDFIPSYSITTTYKNKEEKEFGKVWNQKHIIVWKAGNVKGAILKDRETGIEYRKDYLDDNKTKAQYIDNGKVLNETNPTKYNLPSDH